VGMSVGGIVRVVVAGMIVRMRDSLHQLMHVLRQPAIRFQTNMEHRGEPGQGKEEREDELPIAHFLRSQREGAVTRTEIKLCEASFRRAAAFSGAAARSF
jgi:hypothetical protein